MVVIGYQSSVFGRQSLARWNRALRQFISLAVGLNRHALPLLSWLTAGPAHNIPGL
ncbi:MAG TPA: hypothetical protein VEU11_06000 [Terriglobales bacterium]|jgi:hypothetical protein|nr:hypothetical protein [Terriglobales bacterium]